MGKREKIAAVAFNCLVLLGLGAFLVPVLLGQDGRMADVTPVMAPAPIPRDVSLTFAEMIELTEHGASSGEPLNAADVAEYFSARHPIIWDASQIRRKNPGAFEALRKTDTILLYYFSATAWKTIDPIHSRMRNADKWGRWSSRTDRWYYDLTDPELRAHIVRFAVAEAVTGGYHGLAMDNGGVGARRLAVHGVRAEEYGRAILSLLDELRVAARNAGLKVVVNHNAPLTGDDRWLGELTSRRDLWLMFEGARSGLGDIKSTGVLRRIVDGGQVVWLATTPATDEQYLAEYAWYKTFIEMPGLTYFSAEGPGSAGVKGAVTPHPLELLE